MGWSFFLSRAPYEEKEWRYVEKFLTPGMIFIDIGANQGFYTILASKLVGSLGKVYAFEPAPPEFGKLRCNIKVNGCQNVIAEPFAVGEYEGVTGFYVCLDGHGGLSGRRAPPENTLGISGTIRVRTKLIELPIVKLDDYVNHTKLQAVDFVKLDIEGGELPLLKGATHVLSTLRPVIMCEFAGWSTERWGYSVSDIYAYLEGYGYQWFRIARDGTLNPFLLSATYSPEWEDLVGVPSERVEGMTKSLLISATNVTNAS